MFKYQPGRESGSWVLTLNPDGNRGRRSVNHKETADSCHGQITIFHPPGPRYTLPVQIRRVDVDQWDTSE